MNIHIAIYRVKKIHNIDVLSVLLPIKSLVIETIYKEDKVLIFLLAKIMHKSLCIEHFNKTSFSCINSPYNGLTII